MALSMIVSEDEDTWLDSVSSLKQLVTKTAWGLRLLRRKATIKIRSSDSRISIKRRQVKKPHQRLSTVFTQVEKDEALYF